MPDIILVKTTNDLQITNGDFVIQNSDEQETSLLLQTFPGNWFEWPLAGIGIQKYLAGSESAIYIEQKIKEQMISDGFIIENITIEGSTLNNPKINITAHRK